ncbi:MAG: tetratricopeptide repeat protein, partial [Isosphaeraceae bacterium]
DDRKPDEVEFQPARFWLARRLVLNSGRYRPRMIEGEKHLRRLLKANPNALPIKMTMADYYFLNGMAREARPFLEEVAPNNPDYLVKLAGVCSILGDKEESRRRANQVIDLARPLVEKDPKNLGARIHWSNALVVLEDFENSLGILKSADVPEESKPLLNQTMAVICASWADSLAAKKATAGERLDVLIRGLDFDPNSTPLHTRIADLLSAEGEDYKRVRELMLKMIENDQSPALIHFALGNDEWTRGRLAEARAEWQKALDSKRPMPLAANNLAWSLAYLEPLDLNRALDLIEKAAALMPNNPQIRGTHGQVLTKLGRWEEAAPKLEEVIRLGLGSPAIHRALADAYDHLNKPVLATEHRRTAEELAAAAPPSTLPAPGVTPPANTPGTTPAGEPKSGSK